MEVLFIGTMVSNATMEDFLRKGIPPQPADIAQKYIISGLKDNGLVKQTHAICSPRIPDYTESGIKRVKDEVFMFQGIEVKTVGYRNTFGLGFLNRELRLIKACQEYKCTDKHLLVILYSLNSTFLKAAAIIKKKYPKSIIAVIVADLPAFMSAYSGVKKFAKQCDAKIIELLRRSISKYVLYSKHMAEPLRLGYEDWIVIEGFANSKRINIGDNSKVVTATRICVYAGDLNPLYGVDKLVEAFEKVANNAELHIYGKLDESSSLYSKISASSFVKYCGLQTPDKIFEIFKKADLLINPRPSSIPHSRYACPSKTFEYMSSGTAAVMCRLPGIPDEYFDYVYTFDDESQDGMEKTLSCLLNKPIEELNRKGKAAALFLKQNKTADVQVNKIIQFCCQ